MNEGYSSNGVETAAHELASLTVNGLGVDRQIARKPAKSEGDRKAHRAEMIERSDAIRRQMAENGWGPLAIYDYNTTGGGLPTQVSNRSALGGSRKRAAIAVRYDAYGKMGRTDHGGDMRQAASRRQRCQGPGESRQSR